MGEGEGRRGSRQHARPLQGRGPRESAASPGGEARRGGPFQKARKSPGLPRSFLSLPRKRRELP
eukprot:8472597-Pyramimonas_sp.AAC.1